MAALFEVLDPPHAGSHERVHLGLRQGVQFLLVVIDQAQIFHCLLRMKAERVFSSNSRSATAKFDNHRQSSNVFSGSNDRALRIFRYGMAFSPRARSAVAPETAARAPAA